MVKVIVLCIFQRMESDDHYYIGVDVGTASVRAGLVNSQGKVHKPTKSEDTSKDRSGETLKIR